MKLKKAQIKTLQEYLKDKPVIKAYIFGSYARGKADEKSDLDLLIELDYSKHIGLNYIKMKNDIEELLKTPVDIVTPNSLTSYLKSDVDLEKELIYTK